MKILWKSTLCSYLNFLKWDKKRKLVYNFFIIKLYLDINMNGNDDLDNFFKLTSDYIKEACKVAGDAFQDDPVTIFSFPDEKERREKLQYSFKMIYQYGVRNGVTYATSKDLEGIIIWLPPNKIYPSTWTMMRHGGFYAMRKVGLKFKAMKRSITVFNYEEAKHKELVPYDHWYLQNIAVKPEEQRKGYGGLLVGAMLKKIDSEGVQFI